MTKYREMLNALRLVVKNAKHRRVLGGYVISYVLYELADLLENSAQQVEYMNVELRLPEHWFLYALKDDRTPANFRGQLHEHRYWICQLQHVSGGRLTQGKGSTPQSAFDDAVKRIWP